MKPVSVSTSILASSIIGTVLLSIGALGFSTTPGEMSKLTYNGNLWCVSNWIEEEDAQGNHVYLPDPDGRGKMDHRLQGKTDWLRLDQVEAETKEEAEEKATRKGLFEPSEKNALRGALDKSDKAFFTSHFNRGATSPGPCVGSGAGTGIVGMWINDAIRQDCFDIEPATTQNQPSSGQVEEAQTACGPTVSTLVPGFEMVPKSGKLGREEHLNKTYPSHYSGSDSAPLKFAGDGAFAPHTTEQERYYINSQWKMFDWSGTGQQGQHDVRQINSTLARQARSRLPHSKIVIRSKETGRTMVVSAEESGPALWVTKRDGVNFGAPPEVYNYLGTTNPYTRNPNDGRGAIEVLGFAKDQSIKLGPCK